MHGGHTAAIFLCTWPPGQTTAEAPTRPTAALRAAPASPKLGDGPQRRRRLQRVENASTASPARRGKVGVNGTGVWFEMRGLEDDWGSFCTYMAPEAIVGGCCSGRWGPARRKLATPLHL